MAQANLPLPAFDSTFDSPLFPSISQPPFFLSALFPSSQLLGGKTLNSPTLASSKAHRAASYVCLNCTALRLGQLVSHWGQRRAIVICLEDAVLLGYENP